MKRLFLISIVACLSCVSICAESSLSFKIGYIDRDSVINSLPNTVKLNRELHILKAEYEVELNNMVSSYNEKVKKYLAQEKTANTTIRNARQAEITAIELRIDKYKTAYQAALSDFKSQGMKPIYAKFDNAVSIVAKDLGVNMVLDAATPIYVDENCVDLTRGVVSILCL